MAGTAATQTLVLPNHLGRVGASLFCRECGGDMIRATCVCGHELCPECVGCATCRVHDRGCLHRLPRREG